MTTKRAWVEPFVRRLRDLSPDPAVPRRWHVVEVPDLAAAERLFDALERQGVAERELVVRGGGPITVRWRV